MNKKKYVLPTNNNPNTRYNVRVYTSNNWDPAAEVRIKDLTIDREDRENKLTEWKKVYSQQFRNHLGQWKKCSLNSCSEVYDGAENKNFMRLGHILDQVTRV